MSGTFKDHFSGHAADYARFRPGYPVELYRWLAGCAPGSELAWDAGTGNGQAATGLAAHFTSVLATDASAEQIRQASGPANVTFARQPAESSSLADGAADLVTVGQALHWFDLDAFYTEVRRVLKPGGVLAAWTYVLNRISPEVDAVVRRFYADVVGPFWPPERRFVEDGYATLPFPFKALEAPVFRMRTQARVQDYLAYVGTWSAVQRYRRDRGEDPLELLAMDLEAAWGDPSRERTVEWPLALRAGLRPTGS